MQGAGERSVAATAGVTLAVVVLVWTAQPSSTRPAAPRATQHETDACDSACTAANAPISPQRVSADANRHDGSITCMLSVGKAQASAAQIQPSCNPVLTLVVRDASSMAAVPNTSHRIDEDGTTGALTLVVTAPGYHPARRPIDTSSATSIGPSIEILLAPLDQTPGVTLLARGPDGTPVEFLFIEAFATRTHSPEPQHAPGTRHAPETPRRSLWVRHSRANDGRHPLPSMPPGEVELQVSAVDAGHRPLPLNTERRSMVVDGLAAAVELISFAPGPAVWIELLHPDGRSLDPTHDGPLHLPCCGSTASNSRYAGGRPSARVRAAAMTP
jgi:hypothetical protein